MFMIGFINPETHIGDYGVRSNVEFIPMMMYMSLGLISGFQIYQDKEQSQQKRIRGNKHGFPNSMNNSGFELQID